MKLLETKLLETKKTQIKISFEMKDSLKKAIPSAKWNSKEKVWEVGARSGKKLEAWVLLAKEEFNVNEIAEKQEAFEVKKENSVVITGHTFDFKEILKEKGCFFSDGSWRVEANKYEEIQAFIDELNTKRKVARKEAKILADKEEILKKIEAKKEEERRAENMTTFIIIYETNEEEQTIYVNATSKEEAVETANRRQVWDKCQYRMFKNTDFKIVSVLEQEEKENIYKGGKSFRITTWHRTSMLNYEIIVKASNKEEALAKVNETLESIVDIEEVKSGTKAVQEISDAEYLLECFGTESDDTIITSAGGFTRSSESYSVGDIRASIQRSHYLMNKKTKELLMEMGLRTDENGLVEFNNVISIKLLKDSTIENIKYNKEYQVVISTLGEEMIFMSKKPVAMSKEYEELIREEIMVGGYSLLNGIGFVGLKPMDS